MSFKKNIILKPKQILLISNILVGVIMKPKMTHVCGYILWPHCELITHVFITVNSTSIGGNLSVLPGCLRFRYGYSGDTRGGSLDLMVEKS